MMIEGERIMIKWILIVMALLLQTGCAAQTQTAQPGQALPGYRQIDMEEAIAMMETESDYIILDVRTPEEFSDKHIPGAINVANETIGSVEIPELPDKEQLIMVYCRSGNRSKQASEKLAALGYTNIIEFGGINDWPGEIASGAE